MGCQNTNCRVCNNSFPACQLRDGKCGSCRSKEAQQAIVQPKPLPPNQIKTY